MGGEGVGRGGRVMRLEEVGGWDRVVGAQWVGSTCMRESVHATCFVAVGT